MTLFVLILLYFLPSIIGHNKRNAAGICLVNLFLGWTIVGWVVALFWACTADIRTPMLLVAGPARFCGQCGTVSSANARFCCSCGRII